MKYNLRTVLLIEFVIAAALSVFGVLIPAMIMVTVMALVALVPVLSLTALGWSIFHKDLRGIIISSEAIIGVALAAYALQPQPNEEMGALLKPAVVMIIIAVTIAAMGITAAVRRR